MELSISWHYCQLMLYFTKCHIMLYRKSVVGNQRLGSCKRGASYWKHPFFFACVLVPVAVSQIPLATYAAESLAAYPAKLDSTVYRWWVERSVPAPTRGATCSTVMPSPLSCSAWQAR